MDKKNKCAEDLELVCKLPLIYLELRDTSFYNHNLLHMFCLAQTKLKFIIDL